MICAGAAHWDVIGRTGAALPPGADVPGRVSRSPGGVAANVARFLAGSGQPVRLVSAVGADAEGAALIAALSEIGIDCSGVATEAGRTGCYLAVEDAAGALHAAVADCDGLDAASEAIAQRVLGLGESEESVEAEVILDGNLAPAALCRLLDGLAARRRRSAFLAASPQKARALAGRAWGETVFYGNLDEAAAVLERACGGAVEAAEGLRALGWRAALVSDGARAAAWADAGGCVSLQPPKTVVRSVTGAGDRLAAAHVSALASGGSAQHCLGVALAAAAGHISGAAP